MTAPKAIRFERTGWRQLDQMQREIADALSVLLSSPFATGKAVRGVALVAATLKTVTHGLGRVPVNVVPILTQATSAGGIVISSLTATTFVAKCATTVTADFWVS